MAAYTTQQIRNVALVGHTGAGKTSLVEAILRRTGVIGHVGLVENGDTTCDFTDEEKQRGHSLFNTLVHCDYGGMYVNLLDTPGSPDFVGQALATLAAVDTVAVVVNASAGIESTTRRMMERAEQRRACRMIIINRIDAENVDLSAILEQIKEVFGRECLPVNLPADSGTKIVDCFNNADGDSDLGAVSDAHTQIVEQVVEVDDALMETYLEQGEVKPEQLYEPCSKALREGHLVPICFTAARTPNDSETALGVDELLDVLARLMPSPCAGNPCTLVCGSAEEKQLLTPEPDVEKPALAHVFKIVNDRFGKMSVFRIHQGKISKDSQLYVGDTNRPIKVGHIYKIQGREHHETDLAVAGDLCAVIKVEELKLGSVLHESAYNGDLRLGSAPFPKPMFGLAVTARSRGDESKIGEALQRLEEEDPTFQVTRDSTTSETIINGMGDMHLRVVLERLKSKYNVEVDTKPPKIAYRETVTAKAEGHHRHKKQTGGSGQFGEVFLRIEPLGRDSGFEFANDIFGGSIPSQFIPAIEKGVRQVMGEGCVAGYPMQDIKVSVYDGKHHPVDSKEVAFVTAARKGFQDAIGKARPVLLEPVVNVEITVPNANMGDIAGDLAGKRGRVQGADMLPGDLAVIQAQVPLAEMANYQSQLKSVTGGQGLFSMELSHYGQVPDSIQQQIISQYKPKKEED